MLYGLIHASGIATFGYALYYDLLYVHLPANLANNSNFESMTAFPGKAKYLTIWNIVLQLVYHSIGLANDVVGSNELNVKRQTTLQKFRDGLFASWAFPTGIFVCVVFWSIYAADRELIFPVIIDRIFPVWLNHALHSAPLVSVIVTNLLVPHLYPRSVVGASILVGGIVWYLSWIVWVNHYSGVWAYPVLEILNTPQRAVFLGGAGLIILGFYFLGEALNSWRWGGKIESKGGPSKKRAAEGKRKTK